MDQNLLMKAQGQAKRIYMLLIEVQDISKQLADALDRNDQVTTRMLISMRSEPIRKLTQAKEALGELQRSNNSPDAIRLRELLDGAEPVAAEERALATQLQANQRLLEQVLTLDKNLNLKIAREKSIYQQNRTSAR